MAQNSRFPDVVTLDDLLCEEEPDHDWLIPGLLERDERAILVGRGGAGKSTLLRQLAVMGASGLHPFTQEPIKHLRSLTVDLENRRRQIRQRSRTLFEIAGDRYKPNFVNFALRPEGLILTNKEDKLWLARTVGKIAPDLLFVGPLYKMGVGDPNADEFAQPIFRAFDSLQAEFRFGLVIEAHPPYGASGNSVKRPAGTAVWERWPDYGLHLDSKGNFSAYRPARGDGEWPHHLRRDGEWPWAAVNDPGELLYLRIVAACRDYGEKPSQVKLAEILGVGQGTISKCLKKFAKEWSELAIDPDDWTVAGG